MGKGQRERVKPYCFAPDGADVGSSGCKPREMSLKHTNAPDGAGLSTLFAIRDVVHVGPSGAILFEWIPTAYEKKATSQTI